MKSNRNIPAVGALMLSGAIIVSGCAGGDLTTREKGAGIGALGGAAAGAAIGAAVKHPAAGAAIGGVVGLGAGAVIGDQMQKRENEQAAQQKALAEQQAQIDKNKAMIDDLKKANVEAKETDRGIVVNLPAVQFGLGSSTLSSDGITRVDQIAETIKKQAPGRRISVEGHASRDPGDNEDYDRTLSEQRAASVANELERAGLEQQLVSYRGLGTASPIASNDTESGRQQNRRVEVIIER